MRRNIRRRRHNRRRFSISACHRDRRGSACQLWLLWVNTAILFLGSIAMQAAKCDTAGPGGLGAGLPADCRGADDGFPGGPIVVARQLASRILRGNDASSGVLPDHRPAARAPCVWRSVAAWPSERGCGAVDKVADLRLIVELCTAYWHFLLCDLALLFAMLLLT